MSHKFLEAKVEDLQRYFTKVLEFLEDEIEKSRGQWEKVSVLARSLNRQVLIEWVARDFKEEGKLLNEVGSLR